MNHDTEKNNLIRIFAAGPEASREDIENLKKYATYMNQFFYPSDLKIEFEENGLPMMKSSRGCYTCASVRRPQTYLRKDMPMAFIIFLCRQQETDQREVQLYYNELARIMKKNFRFYMMLEQGINPILADITRCISELDEKRPYDENSWYIGQVAAEDFLTKAREARVKENYPAAQGYCTRAIHIYQKMALTRKNDTVSGLANARIEAARIMLAAGHDQEAVKDYQESLTLLDECLKAEGDLPLRTYPAAIAVTRELAEVYRNQADAETGRQKKALEMTLKAADYCRTYRKKTEDEKEKIQITGDLANILCDLALLYKEDGQTDLYKAMARESIHEFMNLETEESSESGSEGKSAEVMDHELLQRKDAWHLRLAGLAGNLGVTYLQEKDYEEAIDQLDISCKIYDAFAKDDKDTYEPLLALSTYNLGNAYLGLGRKTSALNLLSTSRQLAQTHADHDKTCRMLLDLFHK